MKHQALFSSKDKNKIVKVSSAAILLGALRVKSITFLRNNFWDGWVVLKTSEPGRPTDTNISWTCTYCALHF